MDARPPGLRVYQVAAALGVVAHAVVPVSLAWLPYSLVTFLALTGALVGLRRPRPADPTPWRLLAIALALSCLGNVVWYALEFAGHDPSPAHLVFLTGLGFAVAAAWRVTAHRSRAERTVALLDTAIVTTGAAILLWVFVAAPTWTASPLTGINRVAVTAYPMVALAIIAALARLLIGGAARVRAFWLVIAGLGAFLVADLLAVITALHAVDVGVWPATVRLIGLALVGLAALDPSKARLGTPPPAGHVQLGRSRLALLWAASAAAPATLVFRLGAGPGGELVIVAAGSLVLFSLVLGRLWGLLRLLAEYVAREHEDRFRALVENADDVILLVDDHNRITYVSPSCERVWGYRPDALAAEGWRVVASSGRRRLLDGFGQLRAGAAAATASGQLRDADGTWRRFEATLVDRRADRSIGAVVMTVRDVTTRWDLEQRVVEQALHDGLTGLPNRSLFVDRVRKALEPSRSDVASAAVLMLNVDDFRHINDVLGHERGDEVLRDVAHRLAAAVRPQDTVARLAGDAFGVLLPAMSSLHDVTAIADRLLAAVQHQQDGRVGALEVRASMGIAVASVGASAHDLLRDADAAMHRAKREGRGSFRVFDPELHAEAVRRLELRMDLKRAVEREELAVVYQPIHELDGGTMVGLEALLRWHHPVRGTVPPLDFVPMAEEAGLIGALGRFVLRQACADVAAYRQRSERDVFVTINVSPLQLHDPSFAGAVRHAVEAHGLPPDALMLELTESIFLQQTSEVSEALGRLRAVGVRLAIDDFGTGYCSLGYLSRYRFDVVKIDKSFVDALGPGGTDSRLILGMLDLVDSLALPAVAEGVEHAEQIRALRAAGCPYGQGYVWSRPVPIGDIRVSRDGCWPPAPQAERPAPSPPTGAASVGSPVRPGLNRPSRSTPRRSASPRYVARPEPRS